jgi:hypothetical protein
MVADKSAGVAHHPGLPSAQLAPAEHVMPVQRPSAQFMSLWNAGMTIPIAVRLYIFGKTSLLFFFSILFQYYYTYGNIH